MGMNSRLLRDFNERGSANLRCRSKYTPKEVEKEDVTMEDLMDPEVMQKAEKQAVGGRGRSNSDTSQQNKKRPMKREQNEIPPKKRRTSTKRKMLFDFM